LAENCAHCVTAYNMSGRQVTIAKINSPIAIFEPILEGKILLDFGIRVSFSSTKSIGESLGCWERRDIISSRSSFQPIIFSTDFFNPFGTHRKLVVSSLKHVDTIEQVDET